MGKKAKRQDAAAPAVAVTVPAPPSVPPAPAAPPRPAAPEPTPSSRAIGVTTFRRVLTELDGSKLCYGEPVHAQGATVIPVARVWAAGGVGYGSGEPAPGAVDAGAGGGGGGGGAIEGHPVGFITVGPDGTTRYESIPDPQGRARAARMLATGAATLLTAVATSRAIRAAGASGGGGRRRLGRRRGAAGLLPRGD